MVALLAFESSRKKQMKVWMEEVQRQAHPGVRSPKGKPAQAWYQRKP